MRSLVVLVLVACQPSRVLYEGDAGYVTGAGAAGTLVFFGLSNGELGAVATNQDGRVFNNTVATGNEAAGAFSMRASGRRILWREPAGTAQMVDVTVLPSTPRPMGAVDAIAAYPTGVLWLASGGGLYQLDDASDSPVLLAQLGALVTFPNFPLIASDGSAVYYPARGGDGKDRLKRFSIPGDMEVPGFALALPEPLIGLHVDEEVWVVLDTGRADSRKAASGIIGPAKLGRFARDENRLDILSENAVSQGARDNVWVAFDADDVYWCELINGQARARRTRKKTLTETRELMDREGCPFAVTQSSVFAAGPAAVLVLPR